MPVTGEAERRELRTAVRGFLESAYPALSTAARVGAGDTLDPAFWSRLSTEVALPGLLVPDKYDGQGLGLTEAVVVLEESARVLLAQPLLSSGVLATLAVLAAGDEAACADLLPRLASGQTVGALALDDAPGEETRAEAAGGGWELTGVKHPVLDGMVADTLLVSARCDAAGPTGLFLVEAAATDRVARDALDLTRNAVTVSLRATPAVRLGDDASAAVERLRDLAAVALSAELVGVADRSLAEAVAYALQREQFGRAIGSFQAVKHLCADMLAAVESSRAAVMAAAIVADEEGPGLPTAASIAKAYCSEQCVVAVESFVQVLGGIGYTWEHPAHLLLRRARTLAVMSGDSTYHRDRLGQLLQLG